MDRGSWILLTPAQEDSIAPLLAEVAAGKLVGREEGKNFYRSMLGSLGGEFKMYADMLKPRGDVS